MAGSGSLSLDEARRLVSVLSDEERLRLSRAISDVTSYQTDHEGTNQSVRELEIIISYFYANNYFSCYFCSESCFSFLSNYQLSFYNA